MSQFRFAPIAVLLAAIGLNMAPALVGVSTAAYAQSMRPELGKPLQAAQDLIKSKKYKDALAKIREADAVANKTPAEIFTIERMRGSAAASAGDTATAARSFEAVIESGKLPPGEQLKYIQAVAGMFYSNHDYAKATTWLTRYQKEGGTDPAMRALLVQTYYQGGNYSLALKEVQATVRAEEKAGRAPSIEQLELLANCVSKTGDKAGYASAMEKLVSYYPKKEYWAQLLNRVQAKPGFSDRLSLDVYRLKLAVGQLTSTSDYMEMSQLALQSGLSAEATKIIDQGYKLGALGTGTDGPRHQRLRDLAIKNAAEDLKTAAQSEAEAAQNKDGTGLVNLGYNYVTAGKFDKGIPLMEKGMKGELKRPDDAKLHMGIAYLLAGKKNLAVQTFKGVQGTDGTADLARYWVMQSNRPIS